MLAYFANCMPDKCIECIKAYKLIWLADRYQLRRSGSLISGDKYFAMQYGPVPSNAKFILNGKQPKMEMEPGYRERYLKIKSKCYAVVNEPEMKVFSHSDREVMKAVFERFGGMSVDELSKYSHTFPEWKKYQNIIEGSGKKSCPIDIDLFFQDNDKDSTGFFDDDPKALKLAKEVYHSYNR